MRPTGDNEARAAYLAASRRAQQEYEALGYRVAIEPTLWLDSGDGERSNPLGFRPDIVAGRDPNEIVVVEIRSRGWAGAEPTAAELERRVAEALPQARFVTVLARSLADEELPSPGAPAEPSAISGLLKTAHEVSEHGWPEVSLMLAGSALEGALRHVVPADIEHSQDMLRWAAVEGPIEHDLYVVLKHVLRYRNALAHGRQLRGDFPEDFGSWADIAVASTEQAVTVLLSDWPRPPSAAEES